MKQFLLATALFLSCSALVTRAQDFDTYFTDRTLRIDYQFTGNARHQEVCLDKLSSLPTWAGRRHHLSEVPVKGNGQITVRDAASKTVIYRNSFSSLFQEWISTEEAQRVSKGFENSFLIPYPRQKAEVEVTLMDARQDTIARMSHVVDPEDILINRKGEKHLTPHKYILRSGSASDCIDIALLAEGYTEDEMDLFYRDAGKACESIFSYEPFASMKERFNIVAVASPSRESGVSVPKEGDWRETAFNSHYSTFYSDRYLTTLHVKAVHDALAGIPYEHIIILANTPEYGGGGIYNSYTLTSSRHATFRPVIVHEFGHSFGALADEYFYDDDVMTGFYPLDVEPWEQNITTRVDLKSKWEDMLEKGTPVPTPRSKGLHLQADGSLKGRYAVGVFEGGGYSSKGVYSPSNDCRMRTNEYPAFCPVCQRALKRMIDFYTK